MYTRKDKSIFITSIATILFALTFIIVVAAPEYGRAETVVVGQDDPNIDVPALRAAVTQIGTVILEGTFDFGEYDLCANNGVASRKSVLLTKSVTIQGRQDSSGNKPVIRRGYFPFIVSAVGSGMDVRIRGLHFENNGGCSVMVVRLGEGSTCKIENNDFTDNLWVTFHHVPRASLPDGNLYWKSGPAGPYFDWIPFGNAVRAVDPNIPKRLWYNPSLLEWYKFPILVGSSSTILEVRGTVLLEGNYIDNEIGLDPDITPPTYTNRWCWWNTYGAQSVGTAVSCQYVISNNIMKNCSSRGITVLDTLGTSIVEGNDIELGPLGSYQFGSTASAFGISAVYSFFDLLGPDQPQVGGDLSIVENTITCNGRDQVGILGEGYTLQTPAKTWNNLTIFGNAVSIENGRIGLRIADVYNATVVENKIDGSAMWGLYVGGVDQFLPGNTDFNTFIANQLSRLHASIAQVYFDYDTHSNTLVGFSGSVIDLGMGNRITGKPHSVSGGVGPKVSEVMKDLYKGDAVFNILVED